MDMLVSECTLHSQLSSHSEGQFQSTSSLRDERKRGTAERCEGVVFIYGGFQLRFA
jgi:hypothetical protein